MSPAEVRDRASESVGGALAQCRFLRQMAKDKRVSPEHSAEVEKIEAKLNEAAADLARLELSGKDD